MPERLLDAVRVLDLSDGCSAGGTDMVTRLLADLGADVLKVEPPRRQPRTPRAAHAGRHQHRVRHAQREQTQRSAQPARRERPSAVLGPRRQRRHRRRLWSSGTGRRVRGIVCRVGRSLPTPGGAVDHRLWRCRSAVVMARDRSGAVRDEWCSLAVGPYRRHAGTAAGRYRFGNRSGAGSLGRTGRLFQPITLWYWGLHRLLPV